MSTTTHDDRWFAAIYERASRSRAFRSQFDALRQRVIAQARGQVVEIGAGGGQNFPLYDPAITQAVTAIEPNKYLLRQAAKRVGEARVPIVLVQGVAESLPVPDDSADTVLATLVLCSVDDLDRTLAEMRRVLKPGGTLALMDHVRNPARGWARLQDVLTPIQRRFAGNCHLNRDTLAAVRRAGFAVTTAEWSGGGIHPMLLISAQRPQ
jgi:ubiquinone/menaquinone biosynthesis C-methylase UbiE